MARARAVDAEPEGRAAEGVHRGASDASRKTTAARASTRLSRVGKHVGRKRVIRLMQAQGLSGSRSQRFSARRTATTTSRSRRTSSGRSSGLRAQPALGRRHDRAADAERRQVVPGGHYRPVLPVRRGLGAERGQRPAPHPQGARHGAPPAVPRRRAAAPLRPGLDLRERGLPATCSHSTGSFAA